MAFNSCDPCTCIPANIDAELFHNMAITVLCNILAEIQGTGGIGEDVNISAYGGVATSLGQKVMASSIPVVLASDQSSITIGPSVPGTGATNLGKAEDAAAVSGDTGVAVLGVRNETDSVQTSTDGDYGWMSLDARNRQKISSGAYNVQMFPGTFLDSNNDTAEAGSTASVINATAHTVQVGQVLIFGGSSGSRAGITYAQAITANTITVSPPLNVAPNAGDFFYFGSPTIPATNTINALRVYVEEGNQSNTSNGLLKLEDASSSSGQAGVMILQKQQAIPANDVSNDGDYQTFRGNTLGYLYVDPVLRATPTHTQPTITTATSFTLLAANTSRRYLLIQNNSSANIMINLANGTLTGIVPTSTNLGIVLIPGASYESPPNYVSNAAITVYQTSGGNINTVSVVEG